LEETSIAFQSSKLGHIVEVVNATHTQTCIFTDLWIRG